MTFKNISMPWELLKKKKLKKLSIGKKLKKKEYQEFKINVQFVS